MMKVIPKSPISPKKKSYMPADIIDDAEVDVLQLPSEENLKLKGTLYIPQTSHGYSLAVQYVRDWFVSKFDPDYFKTVYINGKHIMTDFKKYSRISLIVREKPAVAITPMINLDYDRNTQDLYMGGKEILLNKFNHHQGFFKDYEHNIFLGMNVREQNVNFNIKCKVESRAEQLDLAEQIRYACRVGFTQYEFISADFHLPMQLVLNIARAAGFVVKDVYREGDKGDKVLIDQIIENVPEFLVYMNNNSEFPVVYKMRGASGHKEFFVRVKRVYCHIDNTSTIDIDEGTREGHIDNEFHVEMNISLQMWIPAFYAYKSSKPINKFVTTGEGSNVGLWYIKKLELPDMNEDGWKLYINTDYELDNEELMGDEFSIDMTELFTPDHLAVIKDAIDHDIDPSDFISIEIHNVLTTTSSKIDWNTMRLSIAGNFSNVIALAIYVNNAYYNGKLIELYKLNETSLK